MVKGSDTGAVTDSEGKYTIKVPSSTAVLVFSFLGYDAQEIPVGTRSQIDVTMIEIAQQLDDVVLVGDRTQVKGRTDRFRIRPQRRKAYHGADRQRHPCPCRPNAGYDRQGTGRTTRFRHGEHQHPRFRQRAGYRGRSRARVSQTSTPPSFESISIFGTTALLRFTAPVPATASSS